MALTEKTRRRIGYVMSGLVVAFMIFDGTIKLIPMDVVLEASEVLGYLPTPELARTLGVLGLSCTALYVYPRTAVIGAILLSAYMGGTVASHFRVGNPLFTHVFFGVYLALFAWGGLYLRDARLHALLPFRKSDARV
ncbi:MAG TPA: DoxX family protein [Sphingomicrobium sp.]|nr:DoxX family protein [Sphingomicrobium sp.]